MQAQNFGPAKTNIPDPIYPVIPERTKIMMQHPSVAVVILNWNGIKLLEQFIPPLLLHTPSWVQIIVGDNASTDQSVPFLKTNFPTVRVIQNDINYGYAEGYNKVLEQVEATYFILLNSDVEVTDGWVTPLIDYLETHTDVAVCQPKIRSWHSKKHFEYAGAAGGFMDRYGYFFCRGRLFDTLEEDLGQYDDNSEIFWASGAAFFIRAEWFRRAGGFDAMLFAHMEEIDLCWRLKLLGQKIAYVSEAVVYHVGGGTLNKLSPTKTYLNFRNNLILLYKNLESGARLRIIATRFVLDFLAMVRFMVMGQFSHSFAINRAHFSFLAGLSDWKETKSKAGFVVTENRLSRLKGYYSGSIAADYFMKGKKYFTELLGEKIN